MIDLTPLEVRQKKGDFRRALRGYDPELVDDFLDLVADRMEELVREAMVLRDRVGGLESDLDRFKDKERALSDALMTAQKLREETRSQAEKEGELLVREARSAAEAARTEIVRQIAREEDALRQVRARRAQLVDSFRRLLEREMTELTVIEEALELRTNPAARAQRRGGGSSRGATKDAAADDDRRERERERGRDEDAPEAKGSAPAGRTADAMAAKGGAASAGPGDEAASPDVKDSAETETRREKAEEDWLSSLAEEE